MAKKTDRRNPKRAMLLQRHRSFVSACDDNRVSEGEKIEVLSTYDPCTQYDRDYRPSGSPQITFPLKIS